MSAECRRLGSGVSSAVRRRSGVLSAVHRRLRDRCRADECRAETIDRLSALSAIARLGSGVLMADCHRCNARDDRCNTLDGEPGSECRAETMDRLSALSDIARLGSGVLPADCHRCNALDDRCNTLDGEPGSADCRRLAYGVPLTDARRFNTLMGRQADGAPG